MKNEIDKFNELGIKDKIYSIRGHQVMLDSDLAELYDVKVKRLNEQVKRNIKRFPDTFCFRLTKEEYLLRSQFATAKKGGRTNLPYAFTEQGIAMLSAVLKSITAIEISVKIMGAFVEMRKFLITNAQIFERLDRVEVKHIETDKRIDKVFSLIESKDITPDKGIFFDGQIFDAYKFVSDIFRNASKSIIIIDNYIDDTVLVHLSIVKPKVSVKILTKSISDKLKLDIDKFEKQYFKIEVKVFKRSHDRFIIIDDEIVYHFGASLKDLGKKLFGFSKFEKDVLKDII